MAEVPEKKEQAEETAPKKRRGRPRKAKAETPPAAGIENGEFVCGRAAVPGGRRAQGS